MTTVNDGVDGGDNDITSDFLAEFGYHNVLSSSATQVTFQFTSNVVVTLSGTGFANFTDGVPSSGTITGLSITQAGTALTSWSGLSMAFSQFWTYAQETDAQDLSSALFGGNDTFISHDTSTNAAQGDTFIGVGGNDVFEMQDRAMGCHSLLQGSGGNDVFEFGATYNPLLDSINGGGGNDTLELQGDYSSGITLRDGLNSFENITAITLGAGFDYKITLQDYTDSVTPPLKIVATSLASGNALTFDGSAAAAVSFIVDAGAGNDTISGGAGNYFFLMECGGTDTVGGGGNDAIYFGAALTAADTIDGGSGTDDVYLSGNYAAGLTFGASTMVNVEYLILAAGNSYNLTTNDATVASGQTLYVNASALASGNSLTFNGSAETNGRFDIVGDAGSNILTGGAGNDTFNMGANLTAADRINGGSGADIVDLAGNYAAGLTFGATTMVSVEYLILAAGDSYNLTTNDATVASGQTLTVKGSALTSSNTLTFNGSAETNGKFSIDGGAGTNILTGGAGSDTFSMGANLTAADRIDGGSGSDTVLLAGNYSAGLTFGATTMVNVEHLTLAAGDSYNLTTNDATVASGQTLYVSASALGAGNSLTFDGSAESNGKFDIVGGAGNNILTGGAGNDIIVGNSGNDTITGGLGADHLTSGGGQDRFVYQAVADSTSVNFDTISGFDAENDKFDLPSAVGGVDASVTHGTLTLAYFDTQLAAAVGAGELAPHHAVIFEPDKSTFAGKIFLIVDANGIAGYQAGQDFVFELQAPVNLASLSTADFT